MSKPQLHFAHANSYPAGTYRQFLDPLREHYAVQALDMHAQAPAYPVDDCWRSLARELIDQLAARYTEPVILVGHSLGGVLSVMAARERPDLVRCVVLIDSPIVAGWRALFLRLFKNHSSADKYSPARFSLRRRNLWPNADEARQHFASKPMFAAWAPGVLDDYLEHGLAPHPDGVQLRFTRETETAIYRSLPHHLGGVVRAPFPVPVGFVGGVDSVECAQAGLAATRRLVGRHLVQLPGGHLIPMESPRETAAAAHAMIVALLAG